MINSNTKFNIIRPNTINDQSSKYQNTFEGDYKDI